MVAGPMDAYCMVVGPAYGCVLYSCRTSMDAYIMVEGMDAY